MKLRVSVLLAAAILSLSLNALAKDRLGAPVTLTLKDGRMLTGELYAVKMDSVIIVDALGRSETAAVTDIRQIDLKKPAGRAVRKGAIIGGAASLGLMLAAILAGGDTIGTPQADEIAALSGLTLVGAALGGLAGYLAGGAGRGRTIVLEGLSGERLQRALGTLTRYARASALR